jgi:hypothetical protein
LLTFLYSFSNILDFLSSSLIGVSFCLPFLLQSQNPIDASLLKVLLRVPRLGLLGVVVTDVDGVCLTRVMSEALSELQLEPHFSSSLATCSDQASKLSLGQNRSLVAYFDNYSLIQMNLSPLIVTLFAPPDCNLQLIYNLMPEINRILEPVRQSVLKTVNGSSAPLSRYPVTFRS